MTCPVCYDWVRSETSSASLRGSTGMIRFRHHPSPSVETLPHTQSGEVPATADGPRRLFPFVIVACLLAMVLACFGPALFRGEQFAFRDSAHYYYPLYQRVQEEWRAG